MNKKAMVKPMQAALRKGDLKAIGRLVDDGFPLNELLFDGNNSTALHVAVDLGRHKAIDLLLTAGANPDIKNDQFQESGLHKACEEGDLMAVKLLLEGGADPNIKNDNGICPLMLAAEAPRNARQIVNVLITCGAEVKPNRNGRNPLHSKMTDQAVVDLLVQAGADVNGSFHGITPLMKAMENIFLYRIDPSTRAYDKPQPKIVAALIAAGANPTVRFPREMRFGDDAKGQTIVAYARQKKLPASVLDMLGSGAETRSLKKSTGVKNKNEVRKKK